MKGLIRNIDYDIEYFVYGSGKKILFAFHGFNNHAEDFKLFENFLGNEYTIIAINLFFHGDSHAQNHLVEKGFSIEDLRIFFKEITSLFPASKYTLMGYSLGGRFVLKMMEVFPERIEKIILLAPDGIRLSVMYRFLTQTSLGNKLLKNVVDNPSVFFITSGLIKKIGFIDEKKHQFLLGNYDSRIKREKVQLVWKTLRKIISKKSDLRSIIKKYKIPVLLFFGNHDQIIPPKIGKRFQKGLEDLIILNILESGHKLIKETNIKEIASILSK